MNTEFSYRIKKVKTNIAKVLKAIENVCFVIKYREFTKITDCAEAEEGWFDNYHEIKERYKSHRP